MIGREVWKERERWIDREEGRRGGGGGGREKKG